MTIRLSRREFVELVHNCGRALEIDGCEACALKNLCGKGEFVPPVEALMNVCEVEEY